VRIATHDCDDAVGGGARRSQAITNACRVRKPYATRPCARPGLWMRDSSLPSARALLFDVSGLFMPGRFQFPSASCVELLERQTGGRSLNRSALCLSDCLNERYVARRWRGRCAPGRPEFCVMTSPLRGVLGAASTVERPRAPFSSLTLTLVV